MSLEDLFRGYRIFVDPNGIPKRPALVRKYMKHGGEISTDPSLASLLLVDPSSFSGRHFIRDHGIEKPVLDYRWVAICVDAGRVCDDDTYGGCLTQDDGREIKEDDPDDEPSARTFVSQVPTPRPTPTEPERRSTRVNTPSEASSSDCAPHRRNSLADASHQPPPSQPYKNHVNNNPGHEAAHHAAVYSYQQMVPHYSRQQQQYYAQPSGMPGIPAYHQQQHMYHPAPNLEGHPDSYFANPGNIQLMNHSQYQQNRMQPHHPEPAQDHSFPSVLVRSNDMPFHSQYQQPHQPEPGQEPSSSSAPVRSKRERESVEASGPPRSRRKKHSSSEPEPIGLAYTAEPVPENSVFRHPSGEPKKFFLQIDMPNRIKLVGKIKKLGGKIVTDSASADYSVLYQGSKNFQGLLASAYASSKPTADIACVNAEFIDDCAAHRALCDVSPYLFALPQKRKRAAAKNLSTRGNSNASSTDSPKAKTEYMVQPQMEKKSPKIDTTLDRPPNGPPSPEPPAGQGQIRYQGKFNFLETELQYALEYVEILLYRDPDASMAALMKRLHLKIPHHSAASWQSTFQRLFQPRIDEYKKRSGIAKRKAESLQNAARREVKKEEPDCLPERQRMEEVERPRQVQALVMNEQQLAEQKQNDFDEDFLMFSVLLLDSPENVWAELATARPCKSETSWENLYGIHKDLIDDFVAMVDFFANGGSETEDNAQVWATLATKRTCKSAPTWMDFYQERESQVLEVLRTRTGRQYAAADEDAGTQDQN